MPRDGMQSVFLFLYRLVSRVTPSELANSVCNRILRNESIAEKIQCIDANEVVIATEQMPPYPYL